MNEEILRPLSTQGIHQLYPSTINGMLVACWMSACVCVCLSACVCLHVYVWVCVCGGGGGEGGEEACAHACMGLCVGILNNWYQLALDRQAWCEVYSVNVPVLPPQQLVRCPVCDCSFATSGFKCLKCAGQREVESYWLTFSVVPNSVWLVTVRRRASVDWQFKNAVHLWVSTSRRSCNCLPCCSWNGVSLSTLFRL